MNKKIDLFVTDSGIRLQDEDQGNTVVGNYTVSSKSLASNGVELFLVTGTDT